MYDRALASAISAAEQGAPDRLLRAGMRRGIRSRIRTEERRSESDREAMLERWHSGPIALVPDLANDQHYEVAAPFFERVLGPRLKYSSCIWPEGVDDLRAAEEAMLSLTAERAGVDDGMRILDLGCGWGSMSLWLAEHFPEAEVVSVSNSSSQGDFIMGRAAAGGLLNVVHSVQDVNDLELDGSFDCVISIEMFEHVRNQPALLARIGDHLSPGAPVFIHVFAHRTAFWEFEDASPSDWMARHFFSGGTMPTHDGFGRLVAPAAEVEQSWWIPGYEYARTLEAWLEKMDADLPAAREALLPTYGDEIVDLWAQRWRMFFMACAEFFAHGEGSTVGVSHHRLRLT
jgi:cyclopropane-fatty-acyl-phospholipid synthase